MGVDLIVLVSIYNTLVKALRYLLDPHFNLSIFLLIDNLQLINDSELEYLNIFCELFELVPNFLIKPLEHPLINHSFDALDCFFREVPEHLHPWVLFWFQNLAGGQSWELR